MTIALANLPGAAKPRPDGGMGYGSGTVRYKWNGTAWVSHDGSCTNGTATPPSYDGTLVDEIAYGTCPLDEPLNNYVTMLLQDPEGRVDDMIERYHTQTLSRITCQNAAVNVNRGNGTIIHNYDPLPTPKINQLVIPTGSTRWGYCLLLADDEIKKKVYEASNYGTIPLNLIFGTPIVSREEKQHSVTLTVWVLPPHRVSPETGDDSQDQINTNPTESTSSKLWIIPVVDERYLWQFKHVGTLATDVSGITAVDLPNALVDMILDRTESKHINTKANTVYDLLPSCATKNDYENLPIMMDSIFAHYGQRLVVDIGCYDEKDKVYKEIEGGSPLGETRFAVVDGLNSKRIHTNNLKGELGLKDCVWGVGGEIYTTSSSSGVYIVGKPFLVAGGQKTTFGTEQKKYATAPRSVDIQLTEGAYVNKEPGSNYQTFPATAIWRTEYDDTPSADEQSQLGRDYFLQYFLQFDYTFAGVQPWQQGYCDDYTVIRQTWNPKTCTYDAYTRVCSRQPNLTGEWVKPATGSGAPTIRFTILSTDFTVGFGALGCDHVVVLVKHVSCGATGVAVGDEVRVYDPEYCHFNLPIELLVGLSGTATWMKSANYQDGLEYLDYCIADLRAAGCMWMIDTLCCAEEENLNG